MKRFNSHKLILAGILTLVFSCAREINFSERISGKWSMVKVLELSEDVTESHNPGKNRWISFKADPNIPGSGSFESGTGEEMENTGRWFFNKEEKEFFLDSDAGEEDDSYWEVSFNSDSMHWKGRKFEFNKRFELFFKKIE